MDGDDRSGGSLELARLVDEFGEALIPDLRCYYGIDLRDLFAEDRPMSPRWVLMHAFNLPVGSAFVAEQRGGPQFRGWDETRYMIASVYNVINILKYITILANRNPDAPEIELPEPYPLPDDLSVKRPKADKPGSFGFIARSLLAKAKKRKAGGS